MGIAANETAPAQPGAVAALIRRYLLSGDRSKRGLARALSVDVSRIQALAKGMTYGGARYLGIHARGESDVPFLRRVADELEIPDGELMEAVALDLGLVKAAPAPVDSSLQGRYLHEQSFVGFLPPAGNIIPIEAARQRRRSLRLAPRRDSVAQ